MEKGSREEKKVFRSGHRCCCCFLRLLPIVYSVTQEKGTYVISAPTVGIEMSRSTLFFPFFHLVERLAIFSFTPIIWLILHDAEEDGEAGTSDLLIPGVLKWNEEDLIAFSASRRKEKSFSFIPSPFFGVLNKARTSSSLDLILCYDVNTRNRLMGVTTTTTYYQSVSKTWAKRELEWRREMKEEKVSPDLPPPFNGGRPQTHVLLFIYVSDERVR